MKTQIPTTRFRTVQRLLHTNLSTFLTKEPRSIRSLYCIIAYPCQNVKRNLGFNKEIHRLNVIGIGEVSHLLAHLFEQQRRVLTLYKTTELFGGVS